ncbi:MAG: PhoH family protein, partial [Desulfobacterales bacterium]|nr:PhoH family protein [Desulfobacterales bacterium]
MEIDIDNNLTKLIFSDINLAKQLFGEHNNNLQRVADAVDVKIHARGNTAFIEGEIVASNLAQNVLKQLYGLLKENYPVYPNDIDYAVKLLSNDDHVKLKDIFLDTVYITAKKHSITPKSLAQKEYIDAMRGYDIVFGIGPAGTGKTYLAMAMGISALTKGLVSRIILTRPAVE